MEKKSKKKSKKKIKKKNQNKNIFIGTIIIALLIILLFITSLDQNMQVEITTNTKYVDTCKDIENSLGKQSCYMNLAVERKDPSICKPPMIPGSFNSGRVPDCLLEVYVAIANPINCASLHYDPDQKQCYKKIYKNTNDSTICNSLSVLDRETCTIVVP